MLEVNVLTLALFALLCAAEWGHRIEQASHREYFYVGGEYANLTVSNRKDDRVS